MVVAVTRSNICQRVQSYTSAWRIPTPCQYQPLRLYSTAPQPSTHSHSPLPSAVPSSVRQQLMLAGHSRVRTGLNRQPSVPLAHCWHTANWQHTQPKKHITTTTAAAAIPTPALSCCFTRTCTHKHTHAFSARLATKLQCKMWKIHWEIKTDYQITW